MLNTISNRALLSADQERQRSLRDGLGCITDSGRCSCPYWVTVSPRARKLTTPSKKNAAYLPARAPGFKAESPTRGSAALVAKASLSRVPAPGGKARLDRVTDGEPRRLQRGDPNCRVDDCRVADEADESQGSSKTVLSTQASLSDAGPRCKRLQRGRRRQVAAPFCDGGRKFISDVKHEPGWAANKVRPAGLGWILRFASYAATGGLARSLSTRRDRQRRPWQPHVREQLPANEELAR